MPLISVVIATYNRSTVLALALDTALRQTQADLEVIVVGDACTDDSEAVVRAVADPRVRWVNRASNAGEQSAPNNDGVALARGHHVAFLNHDDLWWPDHLERLVEVVQDADLAFAFSAAVLADGSAVANPPSASGLYEPHQFVPASGWLARRELIERIGPWRPARELYSAPSTDWLLRAHRAGAVLRQSPLLTLLTVPSGIRPGSYLAGDADHVDWHRRLTADPERLRGEVASAVAVRSAAETFRPRPLRVHARRAVRDVARRAAMATGRTPMHLLYAVRYRRRGGFIAELRRIRGLD